LIQALFALRARLTPEHQGPVPLSTAVSNEMNSTSSRIARYASPGASLPATCHAKLATHYFYYHYHGFDSRLRRFHFFDSWLMPISHTPLRRFR
jgi:hypothetical protein